MSSVYRPLTSYDESRIEPFCFDSGRDGMYGVEVFLVQLVGGKGVVALGALEDAGVVVGLTVFAQLQQKNSQVLISFR